MCLLFQNDRNTDRKIRNKKKKYRRIEVQLSSSLKYGKWLTRIADYFFRHWSFIWLHFRHSNAIDLIDAIDQVRLVFSFIFHFGGCFVCYFCLTFRVTKKQQRKQKKSNCHSNKINKWTSCGWRAQWTHCISKFNVFFFCSSSFVCFLFRSLFLLFAVRISSINCFR